MHTLAEFAIYMSPLLMPLGVALWVQHSLFSSERQKLAEARVRRLAHVTTAERRLLADDAYSSPTTADAVVIQFTRLHGNHNTRGSRR